MTPDLTYLAYSALLLGLLWLPFAVGRTIADGFPTAETYRDPTMPDLPLWVQRANRAHINNVQVFAPFAALVLIAHITGQSNVMTALWCAVFFWARIAHAVVHLLGIAYVRTIAFLVGFAALLGLFWEVAT
jgi:uncharacterized MAPEG superfamily protein